MPAAYELIDDKKTVDLEPRLGVNQDRRLLEYTWQLEKTRIGVVE
jgi:hypothetical protein